MNEVTIVNEKTTEIVDYKNKALEYLSSMGNKLPAKHQTQFLEIAQAFGLNPFKRELYAVGYGDNWNIITGYEVYLKRAERLGKLDGWKCEVFNVDDHNKMYATVTIYRKDWKMPFEHTVYFSEVCQKTREGKLNSVWGKMPSFMCKKVAIAQGFRLCFPDEFGGMPYTADEMPSEEDLKNITPVTEKPTSSKKEKLYTKEEGIELGKVMNAGYPDGTSIFSEEEKTSYRELLKAGEFKIALEQATEIKNKRLAGFDAVDVEVEIEEEISSEEAQENQGENLDIF